MVATEKEVYYQRMNMQKEEQIKDLEKRVEESYEKFNERESYWRKR